MDKFTIKSYIVTSRGIGLKGGDIIADSAEDGFKWIAPGDLDFPEAAAKVKELREGEEERKEEHMKLLEELF